MKSLELFAGAGGLALGISQAGFVHEAVIECNPDACRTLKVNKERGTEHVKDWPLYPGYVEDFPLSCVSSGLDLVSGGPPCQPFSLGGKHRGHADHRNMFPEAVRVIRELKPRAIILENVKGLLRQSFARYFEYIRLQITYPDIGIRDCETWTDHLSRLEEYHTHGRHEGLFYRVVVRLLNAADYGVAQKRERVIIVGFRSDIEREWSFPKPTHSENLLLRDQWVSGEYWDRHKVAKSDRPEPSLKLAKRIERLRLQLVPTPGLPWRTVRDALEKLPEPTAMPSSEFQNHIQNLGARTYPGHTGSPLDEPAKTLKAGDHGVPGGENVLVRADGRVRYFTVRESARLQGFPDDYTIEGSWTEAMRQLGNAVPVDLAKSVATDIHACLQH